MSFLTPVDTQSLPPNHYQSRNFEGFDIRGQVFPGSWHHANFSRITSGPTSTFQRLRQTFTLFLAFLAGFITAYAGSTFGLMFQDLNTSFWILGLVVGFLLVLFFGTALRNGLTAALGVLSFVTAFLIVITVALASQDIAGLTALSTLTIGGSVAGSVGLAASITLIQSRPLSLACSTLGLIIGSSFSLPFDFTHRDILWILAFSLPVLSLGTYLGHCTLQDDSRYKLLRNLAIQISTWHSTSFRTSDLTGANFSQAKLRFTDFRNANLTRTYWYNATFFQNNLQGNPTIRRLVTTLDGHGKIFDRLDLRGVNLDNADLTGASFIGADLSHATLKGANLTNAKLVKAQLYETNLSGAILTGAYIENWGISPETDLASIQCDYVYMRKPTEDDPDPCRKPDNKYEIFREGDFAAFIAPIIKTLATYQKQNVDPRELSVSAKTLDLYHYEGIDPSATAIALQRLAEQHPEANLQIVSLEGRGDEKIRVQATVADEVDRSELSEAYSQSYREIKSLPYADLQLLLKGMEEKDARIRSLEQMVTTALSSNKFYVESYHSLGDTVSEKSSINIQAGGDIGNVSGITGGDVSGVINLGEISGDVTNTINQLPDALPSNEPGLKELLSQLQVAIEAEPELPDEDKAEALEQVKVLAEAGQNPEDNFLQKAAKTAMKILKGTTAGLSETTKLVQECNKLLPLIAPLLLLV